MPISDESAGPSRARRGIGPSPHDQSAPRPPRRVTHHNDYAYDAGGTYGASRSTRAAGSTRAGGKSAEARYYARKFRGSMVRTIAGTIVPGLGLIGTKLSRLGFAIVTLLIAGTAALVYYVLQNPTLTAGNILQSDWISTIGIVLGALALVWVSIIVGTYLISRPRKMSPTQRAVGAVVVGTLSFLVSAPLAVGSAYSFQTAVLSGDIFHSEDDTQSQTRPTLDQKDPWAHKPRVNILLVGGDSGEGREADLGIRTDTMMLASIDTTTGSTLIIQLPRNLPHAPFPETTPLYEQFPYGFNDGATSMLNAIWNDVPAMFPGLFANTDYPGADALKWAIEGITGLPVDYFVLINIDGLVNLVDAMGGVTLNINFPIPMGGSTEWGCGQDGWIPEGPGQHLDGIQAMWYARSRCNSPGGDFGRMERQSCLVNAVIDQADPATMATRYEAIAKATGDMVSTDIPQEHLSAMVDLAGRVQQARSVQRLAFIDGQNGYDASYPDFDLMKEQVAEALGLLPPGTEPTESAPAEPTEPAPPPVEPTDPGQVPETTGDPEASPTPTGPTEDVADVCAYRHEEPAGDVQVPATVPVYTPSPSTEPTP